MIFFHVVGPPMLWLSNFSMLCTILLYTWKIIQIRCSTFDFITSVLFSGFLVTVCFTLLRSSDQIFIRCRSFAPCFQSLSWDETRYKVDKEKNPSLNPEIFYKLRSQSSSPLFYSAHRSCPTNLGFQSTSSRGSCPTASGTPGRTSSMASCPPGGPRRSSSTWRAGDSAKPRYRVTHNHATWGPLFRWAPYLYVTGCNEPMRLVIDLHKTPEDITAT